MMQTTQSLRESEMPTTRFEIVIDETAPATKTRNVVPMPMSPNESVPENYLSIDDLVSEFGADAKTRAELEEGRRWVADAFYAGDGDTVRTLRLKKGWSQTQLADELATSQSHVARIERGTENLYINTCRKLCAALDIDMNTLNELLQRQAVITAARANGK